VLDAQLGGSQLGAGDGQRRLEPRRQRHARLGIGGGEGGALIGESLLGLIELGAGGIDRILLAVVLALGVERVVIGLLGAEQSPALTRSFSVAGISTMRPPTSAVTRTSPLLGSTRPVAEAAQTGRMAVDTSFAVGLAVELLVSAALSACVVFCSATGPQVTLLT
jgi:hypothetical protein